MHSPPAWPRFRHKTAPLRNFFVTILLAIFCWTPTLHPQSGDIVDSEIDLEPFEIIVNAIDVIDGFTEREYMGDHPVVWGFVDTFRGDLINYHKVLLTDEIKHMNFRWRTGVQAEENLVALCDSFDMKGFKINKDQWLVREDAILRRLNTEPFFKIESIVVWDLERLDRMRPLMPDSKYARDIRFNEDLEKWERRVTTRWKVNYWHPNDNGQGGFPVNVVKDQGLNLDTNKGYHLIERGLTHKVYPGAFEEVKLTYPIFFSYREPVDQQVRQLRETYIANLFHIYDPFSWIARRQTRFRGGFQRDLLEHIQGERVRVSDRNWFNPVMANLLNDAVTVQLLGYNEIYDLHAFYTYQNHANVLGEELDLLNWHNNEKRQVNLRDIRPNIWINFNNPGGARWIILDAYLRHTDRFLQALRKRLVDRKERGDPKQIFREAIEEVSGKDFQTYYRLARQAQTQLIAKARDQYYKPPR
jgi:hypothetical protein